MKEFSYLSYCTIYESQGISQELSERGCFGYIFDHNPSLEDMYYKIVLIKGLTYINRRQSNGCLIDKPDLNNYIKSLQRIIPFTFKIEDGKYNGIPSFFVHVWVAKGVPRIQHNFLLTAIRYTYETPFNIVMPDVCKLRKLQECRFISTMNLINVAQKCVASIHHLDSLHGCLTSADNFVKFYTNKELIKRLSEVRNLNSIFEVACTIKNPFKISNKFRATDLEFWSNEFEEQRIKSYLNVINTIKQKMK